MIRQFLLLVLAALMVGCQHADMTHSSSVRIDDAVGAENLIKFDVHGGKLDTADPMPATLTLADVVRLTLQNDPRVQAALARVRIAEADVRQAKLLPNPILDVALRFPEGGGKTVIDASLSADLLALIQRPRRITLADHKLRSASEDALVTVLDALAEVQEHYVALQTAEAQAELSQQRRSLSERLRGLAQEKLRVGEGSRLEVAALDAERVTLEAELAERQLERAEEQLLLTRLIGKPSADVTWQVTPWSAPQHLAACERDWVAAALANRPEVQARRWELVALGDEAALTGLAFLDGATVGGASEREDRWTAGPAFSVPLPFFDWGQAKRDRVKAEQIEARHNFTLAQREAVEEVRRAYVTVRAAQRAVEQATKELVPIQQQRRDAAEAAYRVGEADVTALLLAEHDLREAQERLIGLQQKLSVATLQLERAVGGPGVAAKVEQNAATTQPTTNPTTRLTK